MKPRSRANPLNPLNLITGANDWNANFGCAVSASFDGGKSWTPTKTGLKVKAVLDTNDYETGIKVSDEQLNEMRLCRHKVQPAWNYTISPRSRK